MARETMRTPDFKRVQFDFSPTVMDRLDYLIKRFEAGSRAEIIRRALMIMEHIADEDVYVRDEGGVERKLVLL